MTSRLPLFGVLKQWNNGHVGVPNQSFGSWTFYVKTFFGSNKFAKLLSCEWLGFWETAHLPLP